MSTLVSIGMPAFNSAHTIATSIQSIVDQTHSDWELIVIDDGSTDATAEVVRRFADPRIRLMPTKRNLGLAERLNQSIAAARGDLFARMDADDVAFPERLERQVATLRERPSIDLLASRVVVFDSGGSAIGTMRAATEHAEICRRPWNAFNSLPHPTWIGRRAWFAAIGYDPLYRKAQDRDFLLRAFRASHFHCMPEYLLGYRQENLSIRKNLLTRHYLARSLARQSLRGCDPVLALGVIGQPLKAAVDIVANVSGLQYRMLKHRAAPLDAAVTARWNQVWQGVQTGPSTALSLEAA